LTGAFASLNKLHLDSKTWRSHVPYDAELGSSHGQDNADEYCAYANEEDADAKQQQRII
jgi:hypothetical protein